MTRPSLGEAASTCPPELQYPLRGTGDRAGPGIQAVDALHQLLGGPGPVQDAHFLGEHGVVGHVRLVLGGAGQGARFQGVQGVQQHLRSQAAEALRQLPAGFPGENVHSGGKQHVPGVNALVREHGGNARLAVPLQNAPGDGRAAPVPGQQGGVHVDGAQAGNIQNLLGQNLPKGGGDAQVRGQGPQILHPILADSPGLIHGNAVGLGGHLHRGWGHLFAPALGLVGLGEHAHHRIPASDQRLQGGHGKIRRAHEDDAHQSSSSLMWPSISSGVSSRSILSM